jgi:hypothetical protein
MRLPLVCASPFAPADPLLLRYHGLMKFDELRSIGHNIADSLASGIGLLIGFYDMNIFHEAHRSREGFITVDFLTGKTSGGSPRLISLNALNAKKKH